MGTLEGRTDIVPMFYTDLGSDLHVVGRPNDQYEESFELTIGRYAVWGYKGKGELEVIETETVLDLLQSVYGEDLPVYTLDQIKEGEVTYDPELYRSARPRRDPWEGR